MIYFYLGAKMGNQINIGNQNAQQIRQNHISQSTVSQKKPKLNYWMISALALIFLFFIIVGVYLSNSQTRKESIVSYFKHSTTSSSEISGDVALEGYLIPMASMVSAVWSLADYKNSKYSKPVDCQLDLILSKTQETVFYTGRNNKKSTDWPIETSRCFFNQLDDPNDKYLRLHPRVKLFGKWKKTRVCLSAMKKSEWKEKCSDCNNLGCCTCKYEEVFIPQRAIEKRDE